MKKRRKTYLLQEMSLSRNVIVEVPFSDSTTRSNTTNTRNNNKKTLEFKVKKKSVAFNIKQQRGIFSRIKSQRMK
jgi:hypothetical protein